MITYYRFVHYLFFAGFGLIPPVYIQLFYFSLLIKNKADEEKHEIFQMYWSLALHRKVGFSYTTITKGLISSIPTNYALRKKKEAPLGYIGMYFLLFFGVTQAIRMMYLPASLQSKLYKISTEDFRWFIPQYKNHPESKVVSILQCYATCTL